MPSAPALYERMLTEKAQTASTAWLTNAPTPFLQQDVEDYPNPIPNEKQLSRRLRQEHIWTQRFAARMLKRAASYPTLLLLHQRRSLRNTLGRKIKMPPRQRCSEVCWQWQQELRRIMCRSKPPDEGITVHIVSNAVMVEREVDPARGRSLLLL